MKASVTVEAALLCPFLCLVLCGIIVFTLRLYGIVGEYAEGLTMRQIQKITAPELIRIEAVVEDIT